MRDLLLFAGSALRQSAGLAAERLLGGGGLPRDTTGVTTDWLSGALQERFPGVRVRELAQTSRHSGTTDRLSLRARYQAAATGLPPEAVFVKTAPPDAATRVFINLTNLPTNEVRFYLEIAPALRIERPAALYARVAGDGQRFALVLEDLSARGARLYQVADTIGLEEARLVMVELARLHAPLWESPRLRGDLSFLRAPGRVAPALAACERCLPALALRTALRKHGELVPASVRAAGKRIVASRRILEREWSRGPLTVLHGDTHLGNMYAVDGRIGLLDWQLVQCGQGMRDVAYFLCTSLETELRRAHDRELIALYLSTLEAEGARAPDGETALRQYRLHSLYAWQAAMFTAAAATLQAGANSLVGFGRSSAALEDLEAVAALDELAR